MNYFDIIIATISYYCYYYCCFIISRRLLFIISIVGCFFHKQHLTVSPFPLCTPTKHS